MENQRIFLIIAMMAISAILYQNWIEFSAPPAVSKTSALSTNANEGYSDSGDIPIAPSLDTSNSAEEVPATPLDMSANNSISPILKTEASSNSSTNLITVKTDLVIAKINLTGGVIESLHLIKEPISLDQPNIGFPLLKNTNKEVFVAQDGLLVSQQQGPNHSQTVYKTGKLNYELSEGKNEVVIPLTWTSEKGVEYTKRVTFRRDSYVVNIDYYVVNKSDMPWHGFLYAQFNRSEPESSGGGFGQLPSYTGAALYTEADKYDKVDFDKMAEENLDLSTDNGWVAMLQHYFVGAWIPENGEAKKFYTSSSTDKALPSYRIGYKTDTANTIEPGQSGELGTSVFLGPKEQRRLKQIETDKGISGLALTVDYGFLTFIADPLFTALSWIHSIVGNWGWAIILLTILIKALFYPLSAASYKSMAGMKKLQPRIKTLKDRYKDDKQKFQMEMMALYKKEKINPAGGCLPILIQIPVFISLYWALLESVEIRQAPFALWLQDLSAPDPYFILPVLMGLSMWMQQKLNPAAMDDIQKKVMAIMPIALTFLFLNFPQGLVLYWVVNNVLSMAQQWFINRKYAV